MKKIIGIAMLVIFFAALLTGVAIVAGIKVMLLSVAGFLFVIIFSFVVAWLLTD